MCGSRSLDWSGDPPIPGALPELVTKMSVLELHTLNVGCLVLYELTSFLPLIVTFPDFLADNL